MTARYIVLSTLAFLLLLPQAVQGVFHKHEGTELIPPMKRSVLTNPVWKVEHDGGEIRFANSTFIPTNVKVKNSGKRAFVIFDAKPPTANSSESGVAMVAEMYAAMEQENREWAEKQQKELGYGFFFFDDNMPGFLATLI